MDEAPLISAGRGRTFEDVYRDEYPALKRLAFLLTGSDPLAEDLVQDVFVAFHGRAGAIDNPAAYLRVSLVNAVRRHGRREARAQDPPTSEATMPDHLVELRDALSCLTERERAVIVLRYWCDLPDTEIARTLGCRRSSVRSLARRGLHRLREAIR